MKHLDTDTMVLVTGGSGFLAGYCILKLLEEGYLVKTTVRSIKKRTEIIRQLKEGGAQHLERLDFVEADLTKDDNWEEAVKGCKYVLHVASPFPEKEPNDESELIIPAKEGTLRVLQAAKKAKVKRVVMTSSFAAVGYSINPKDHIFTESDWTNPNANITTYVKSKTLAEKAAWDYIATNGKGLELTVINPVGIFGPVMGNDFSGSIQIIRRMMTGKMAFLPNVYTNLVDVRDVAGLHLLAMTSQQASGQRFLALGEGNMSFYEIAATLKNSIPEISKNVSLKTAPNWLLHILALFKPELRQITPNLGVIRNATNEKAKKVLGWKPRPNAQTIEDTAKSLLAHGIVNPQKL